MPSRRTPWRAPRLLSKDASSSLAVSVCVLVVSPADDMGGRAPFRHRNKNMVMEYALTRGKSSIFSALCAYCSIIVIQSKYDCHATFTWGAVCLPKTGPSSRGDMRGGAKLGVIRHCAPERRSSPACFWCWTASSAMAVSNACFAGLLIAGRLLRANEKFVSRCFEFRRRALAASAPSANLRQNQW